MLETQPKRARATRIIGIDYGLARIGVAVSDERKIIASPLATIRAEKKIEATLAKVMAELEQFQLSNHYDIEEIVIGLPLQMNGKYGMLADEVKHFVELFSKVVKYPIKTWDERLTTVQAERSMRESSMTRKKRAKSVDTITATIILQNYLDSKNIQRMT